MTFRASSAVAMSPANQVGVAIQVVSPRLGLLHVGLLYENRRGEVRLAHLKGDNRAADQAAPNDEGYHWDDCAWLARPELHPLADAVALFVELCAETREIPYGPNPPEGAFDEAGRYVCADRRLGLTCATYVAAVLAGAGYPVVRLDTWQPRPDDQSWWEGMVQYLGAARAEELEGVRVMVRLRPDEAAVSVAAADRPLCFPKASERSQALRALLRGEA